MDVADSDLLSNKEFDDEDSEFETDLERYFVFSTAKNRFFGRKIPLRVTLGSGLIADIILWRNKKISLSVLVGVTFIWLFFKRMDYTVISFICDSLILLVAMLFLRSLLTSFIRILPPLELSSFLLPKGLLVSTAISVTRILNNLLMTFGVIASGQDLKKFLLVTGTLGAISFLDYRYPAATLIYIASVILLIVPVVYEKHGDIIDILAERVLFEFNNLYENLMMKIFGKSQNSQEYIED
ncbi:reticulon-like protein B1 [Vigna umbellata]|uniref:reticulon-like protein B1 n=1 Tax=Vigna umbellata TaxID=87088 RepID=UPI001F5F5DBA|nr:reticulon-like protein B1 [Vigna umbellata]